MHTKLLIIQRIVPHYRVKLFDILHENCGAVVVSASNPPHSDGLHLSASPWGPWDFRVAYWFGKQKSLYPARAPIRSIVKKFHPERLLVEFSLKTNFVYQSILLKKMGLIRELYFWTHGWSMNRSWDSFKNRFAQYARLLAYMHADGVLTYSKEGENFIKFFLPQANVTAIGNTVFVERSKWKIAQSFARTARSNGNEIKILSVGRLTENKGFLRLIGIFENLLNHVPRAKLIIVGGGPLEEVIKGKFAHLLDRGNLILMGPIYDNDVLSEIFYNSDVAAYGGAIGLFANHALAFGLPVIVFDRGWITEPHHSPEVEYVVDGLTGRRIPPGGDAEFIDALVNLARDKAKLVSMRRIAFQYYNEILSVENQAKKMMRALRLR